MNFKPAIMRGLHAHTKMRVAEIKKRLRELKGERNALTHEWNELQRKCEHPGGEPGAVCDVCDVTVPTPHKPFPLRQRKGAYDSNRR